MGWLASLNEDDVYLPSLVLGELRKGIDLQGSGQRRTALLLWLGQFQERFAARTVAFDTEAALKWGELLAALALVHGAVLATRNTADFERTGVPIFDPWES